MVLASAVDTSMETIETPADYGPTKHANVYRDYGPTKQQQRRRSHNTSADLCSLTSSGYETMAGVDILVNHHNGSSRITLSTLTKIVADGLLYNELVSIAFDPASASA